MSAQTPAPAVTSSVFAPPSIECSAPLQSGVTLTGFNNETPGTADIVIVMDESGSIDANEWQKLDLFVDATIDLLDLTNTNNRVGIVKYSSTAQVVAPLTNDAAALKALGRHYPGGSTATHTGISLARQQMVNARPGAEKFIIVLTDGLCTCSSSELLTQKLQAENAGITLVAVGVEGATIPELNLIASTVPGVQTAIFVNNFDALVEAVETLVEAIVTPGATNVNVVVDATPRFPVMSASATAGNVAVNGNQVVWTLPALGAGSQTLTINHQHDGTGNGPQQVFSAVYTDAENHAVSIDNASTNVTGCNVAPVANAGGDQTVSANGATASVTLSGTGSTDDGLIQPLTYQWSSNTGVAATGPTPVVLLPLGTHVFTLTVNDGEFSSTDSVTITVIDTTAPVIDAVVPSTDTLWPPNHSLIPVTFTVSASDNSGAAPTCTISDVTSNEVANGRGDGNTGGDIRLTGDLSVELRSERSGNGNGRTYTVSVSCVDGAGNTSTSTATVVAPKSQGKKK